MHTRIAHSCLFLTLACAAALAVPQLRPTKSRAGQVGPRPTPPGAIAIAVDASHADEKILHARLTIPAAPGPLTLLYPKWIPGEHGPTGPVADLTGLQFTVNGRPVPWRRDEVDMFTLHLDLPAGTTAVEAALDYVSPVAGEGQFTAGGSASAKMAVISWNTLLLYPAGFPAEQHTYRASLKLPQGWQFATALPQAGGPHSGEIQFAPASLYTLVDSPVVAGQFFRKLELSQPGTTPSEELDIAADSTAALQMPPQTEAAYKQLVKEAVALFGARHYRHYNFLLSLSDHVAHFGLEHHESNDSRVGERSLIEEAGRMLMGSLLPHEYVHSWNGKYRRPDGLSTPDYQQPMRGKLLWVYEGLTEYLGDMLAARSGLWTPEQYRDALALTAAGMSYRPGRRWRYLEDTTVAAQILYSSPVQWSSWRRSVDFYPQGELIWLEADSIIRQQTQNRNSLDDFCKLFHGGPSSPTNEAPTVKPYTFDELVAAMNQVATYDWRKFFQDRLLSTAPQAPLGGIEGSGWRLTYTDQRSPMFKAREEEAKVVDASYSLGLLIAAGDRDAGRILDTVFFQPAAKAGIAPGMLLVAVNGRAFTPDVLRDALRASKNTNEPLQLLVENNDYYRTYSLDYHEGEKYPHLERDSGRQDLLSDMIRAHAK